jgi:septum site-determining protein MinD
MSTSQIISIHSYCSGTGKSNIAANLAVLLAMGGKRVGVLDANLSSPGIHYLLGLDEQTWPCPLIDYVRGECDAERTTLDVTERLGISVRGRLLFTPFSTTTGKSARTLYDDYDANALSNALWALIETLELDWFIIDTPAGLDEDALVSVAVSDALVVVLRPNRKDFQGTAATVEMARRLDVPRVMLLANMVPESFDRDDFEQGLEQIYGCPVAALLPYCDEMMALCNESLFIPHYPDHPLTTTLTEVALKLMR